MHARTRPAVRRLGVLGALSLVLSALVAVAAPAQAAPKTPDRFTGYAFDICVAPSSQTMDRWNLTSPYSVIGIYTSGSSRYCSPEKGNSPHLSPAWVREQASKGWRFLTIHVGRQAPCYSSRKTRMSRNVSVARGQAKADAREAVAEARRYGFGKRSTVYLDIEWYDRSDAGCDRAVLEFIDAFNEVVKAKGYRSGLYSSASAAIAAVDQARAAKRARFTFPNQVWFAWTNKKANTDGGTYLADAGWRRQRLHQYHNNTSVSHGGARLTIDKNYIDVGGGSRPGRDTKVCGVKQSQPRYKTLRTGSRGEQVKLLRCLLKREGLTRKAIGVYDRSTRIAVDRYRARQGWKRTGTASAAVWASLLAEGGTPRVLKRGSSGDSVWRLQRSLRAAGASVSLTGIFDARTTKAVQSFRRKHSQPGYPTATKGVWALLRDGKRA